MRIYTSHDHSVYVNAISTEGDGKDVAGHRYDVVNGNQLGTIRFQQGTQKEAGHNGITNEQLIAILIHRLNHLNQAPWNCRENALAITHLEEAGFWLRHRTEKRLARGVEGTSTV